MTKRMGALQRKGRFKFKINKYFHFSSVRRFPCIMRQPKKEDISSISIIILQTQLILCVQIIYLVILIPPHRIVVPHHYIYAYTHKQYIHTYVYKWARVTWKTSSNGISLNNKYSLKPTITSKMFFTHLSSISNFHVKQM